MSRAPQQRRIATHARLLDSAREIVAASSYAEMRVEEVVLRAGVAKGTFFSHFKDKDALLVVLIGEELERVMSDLVVAPPPEDIESLVAALAPLVAAMGSERTVFDIVVRNSGAMAIEEIGPIAQNFGDQIALFVRWIAPLQGTAFRSDADPALLGEGIQAFLVQCIAMNFCLVESQMALEERLLSYLTPWLSAPQA
ncbi:MAG: TetR/AcrR family transcriptional regulator [Pseudomonadota bacterium]